MTDAVIEEQLWTRYFTSIMVGILFLFIPFALYMPILPVYLLKKLHGSLEAAGAVNGCFLIACVFFRAQTALLEKRWGVRRVMMISGFLFMASNLLYLVATTVTQILLIRFFSGACFAVANTSIYATGSRLIPPRRKGEGLAYMTTMVLAGTAIGPYLGLNLARAFGYEAVFIFSALISLLGMLIFFPLKMSQETGKLQPFSFQSLYELKAIPVSLVIFILAIAYGGVVTFITVYAGELHLPVVVDFFFVMMAAASVGTRLLTGKAYDRFGPSATIYPSIMLLALGLLIVGTLHSTWLMLIAAVFVGVGYGMSVPAVQTLAVQLSPGDRVSEVTATFFTCLDGGIGVGAYLLGGSIHAFGYAAVYQGLALMCLACMLMYYTVYARKSKCCGAG